MPATRARPPADAAGADGCRGGWVVATRRDVAVAPRLIDAVAAYQTVGVDMPVGLPDGWDRAADREARRFLGRAGASSIFPTPPRALIEETDYSSANRRSRSTFGKGLTRQSFNLLPKIREVDALARSGRHLVEVHPECSFRALAGVALPSKRTAAGRDARRELLRPHLGDLVDARPAGAAADDVLDALAVLWSIERYLRGEHVTHGDGATDRYGLPMRIVT